MRSYIRKTAKRFDKSSSVTLHQNDKNIGTLRIQYLHDAVTVCRGVKSVKQFDAFSFLEEIKFRCKVLRFPHGGEQTEIRIDCRMIQKLLTTEIHLTDVGSRLGNSTPDNDKQYSAYQQHNSCPCQPCSDKRQNRRSYFQQYPRIQYDKH